MKVEVVSGFYDMKAKEQRLVGEVFECGEKRAKDLETAKLVRALEKSEPAAKKK